MSRPEPLDDSVVDEWLQAHPHWRRENAHLVRDVHTADYASAVEIVRAQVALCERLDHHPLCTVGYRELRVEVWTHDRNALTSLDLAYAQGLDEVVKTVGEIS